MLLDLACGTGSLSVLFSRMGYDVIGVDISSEMLAEAAQKAAEAEESILFLNQDMRSLDLFGTIDVCICAQDSLNHLPGFEDFKKVLNRVSLFLEPGGLFLFDINTIYKHEKILADNTFTVEDEDVFCVWQNRAMKHHATEITLDFFEREGETYSRTTEVFTERAYETSDILRALEEAGFEPPEIYAEGTRLSPGPDCERMVFAAKKRAV